MSKIVSIATGVPPYRYLQSELFPFAESAYADSEEESRKLKFLYKHSGISSRYSVLPDFTLASEKRSLFKSDGENAVAPSVRERMEIYNRFAAPLSAETIDKCIEGKIKRSEITHLITVSCTGMSAPGLDLQLVELMGLPPTIMRSSVNFMGCYAALHGMKIADAFCRSEPAANVIVVCTEFCSLHFMQERSLDNLTSSLIFADGCAALLMQSSPEEKGLIIENFYSEVLPKGKKDMAWELSPTGFLMTLSSYIPDLIRSDFEALVNKALAKTGRTSKDIDQWCIHPGGKKILEAIEESMKLNEDQLRRSYEVLDGYGNMSSPTILFVLQKVMEDIRALPDPPATVFGAAFGPGLTMETFTATYG